MSTNDTTTGANIPFIASVHIPAELFSLMFDQHTALFGFQILSASLRKTVPIMTTEEELNAWMNVPENTPALVTRLLNSVNEMNRHAPVIDRGASYFRTNIPWVGIHIAKIEPVAPAPTQGRTLRDPYLSVEAFFDARVEEVQYITRRYRTAGDPVTIALPADELADVLRAAGGFDDALEQITDMARQRVDVFYVDPDDDPDYGDTDTTDVIMDDFGLAELDPDNNDDAGTALGNIIIDLFRIRHLTREEAERMLATFDILNEDIIGDLADTVQAPEEEEEEGDQA